jgi:hypothetical protein
MSRLLDSTGLESPRYGSANLDKVSRVYGLSIFTKELYEPLWEEILARCKRNNIRVRAIWFADAANKGASGIHNEQYLGNDREITYAMPCGRSQPLTRYPHETAGWMDHSRDMLLMINHFRKEMPQPIMGVGHSLGTTQL